MLKKILVVLLVAVASFLGYVALKPAHYLVERKRVIEVEPEVVFAIVSDLRRFETWSPWSELDPDMETAVEGEPGQVGMSYRWKGNEDAGEGLMTITWLEPPTRIDQKLIFIAPMASEATTSFLLSPKEEGTEVVWRLEGENDFTGKLFDVLLGFDAMIGGDYEEGLSRLDELARADVGERSREATGSSEDSETEN